MNKEIFRNAKILDEDTVKTLVIKAQKGDESAYTDLYNSNIKLIGKVANNYRNNGIEFDDLVQEGSIGFMKAVNKFEASKGVKFSTYATYWIRQAITRAIDNDSRAIRIPVWKLEQVNKVKKARTNLTQVLGRIPTTEEIALSVGEKEETILECLECDLDVLSIDYKINDKESRDTSLADTIVDETQNIEATCLNSGLKSNLDDIISCLNERERIIITNRFGLNKYGRSCSLEEIGDMFEKPISKERVRQIEKIALRKLKNPKITSKLVAFVKGE